MEKIICAGCFSIGSFPMKTALNIIIVESIEEYDHIWHNVRKFYAPQCMRFFFFLVVNDRFMMNSNRSLRALAHSPLCKGCSCANEDIAHLPHECDYAQKVWSNLIRVVSLINSLAEPSRVGWTQIQRMSEVSPKLAYHISQDYMMDMEMA